MQFLGGFMPNKKIKSEDFENNSNVEQDEQTKKKSNAQKAVPWFIVTIVALLVILTCTLIAYYQVYKSSKQNANILEGVYASSYYSMVDNVNNMAVDVSKYSTLTTKQAKLDTMHDIMTDCNYVLAGLSVLPINHENVVATTKFFNQINGMCEAYIKVLNKNENLTQEQELMFDKIALVLAEIKANFNKQNYGMYDASYNFIDAGIFNASGMNELSTSMGNLSSEEVEYPSMIFDGPFSTALETKNVLGLPETEVTQDEAKNYLEHTVFSGKNVKIEFDRLTEGTITTYDFTVKTDDNTYFAQVSRRGGLLISLTSYAETGDPIMGVEQAREIAKNFVNNIGFESMQPVWQEVKQNVAYINLASVENGVVYYPDLVKIKVDLTSQNVIGLEAQNYALNHIERSPSFSYTEADAESLLGFDYEILSTRKTVIRLDSGIEVACFEFYVERIDGNYFYYIDANTNQIAKVMKLVEVKGSQKLI